MPLHNSSMGRLQTMREQPAMSRANGSGLMGNLRNFSGNLSRGNNRGNRFSDDSDVFRPRGNRNLDRNNARKYGMLPSGYADDNEGEISNNVFSPTSNMYGKKGNRGFWGNEMQGSMSLQQANA